MEHLQLQFFSVHDVKVRRARVQRVNVLAPLLRVKVLVPLIRVKVLVPLLLVH